MIGATGTASNSLSRKWGTINNQDIFQFEITNDIGSTLSVCNYGAAALSLTIQDAKGRDTDVLLGYNDLTDYSTDPFYMGTVVGRCANRIAGTEVKIGEELYRLTTKEGGFHHHGGKSGFNKKVWEVVEVEASSVKMRYKSADGEEGYPGNIEVIVDYSFDDDNNWVVEYVAFTDKPTLINLTQHAYFNLEGPTSASVTNHWLQIHAERFLPVNDMQVPRGDVALVKNTPFDFREMVPIGRHINNKHEQLQLSKGYDHTWVLEENHTKQLKHAATVFASKTNIELNVFTTEPGVHFYSGNFLDSIAGKSSRGYSAQSGFCLETQHFPDAPNHPHFPSIVLLPGEIFRSKTIFQLSVR